MITHVQRDLYRIALTEKDWSALSVVPSSDDSGKNEGREVYNGPMAYAGYGNGLQEDFDVQATAFKTLLEGLWTMQHIFGEYRSFTSGPRFMKC